MSMSVRAPFWRRLQAVSVTAVLGLGLALGAAAPAHAETSTGATVSGVVTLDGVRAAGLKVCEGGDTTINGQAPNCVWTTADGTYTLTNVQGFDQGDQLVASPSVFPATAAQKALFAQTNYGYNGRSEGYLPIASGSAVTDANIPVRTLPKAPHSALKLVGKAKVGKRLGVRLVKPVAAGVTVRYQWTANGKAIAGATKTSVKLTKALRGKKVRAVATFSKDGFRTVVKASGAKIVRR